MISVQTDRGLDEALTLMQYHAETNGQTLEEVAVAVVERRIRFGI